MAGNSGEVARNSSQSRCRGIEVFSYPETAWNDDYDEVSAIYAEAFQREKRREGCGLDDSLNSVTGGFSQASQEGAGGKLGPLSGSTQLDSEEVAALVAEASRRSEERGHIKGVEKGMVVAQEDAQRLFAVDRARLHAQAGALAESFAADRERYFHRVELEAVRLALAIAARILRREAMMDPLLLTGAVRVALGQLAESTTVRLRVPVRDEQLWREAFQHMPGLRLCPQVIGDERLELGDCRMETDLGSADVGLRAQLKEIERGFFDRVGSGLAVSGGGSGVMPGKNSETENESPKRSEGSR